MFASPAGAAVSLVSLGGPRPAGRRPRVVAQGVAVTRGERVSSEARAERRAVLEQEVQLFGPRGRRGRRVRGRNARGTRENETRRRAKSLSGGARRGERGGRGGRSSRARTWREYRVTTPRIRSAASRSACDDAVGRCAAADTTGQRASSRPRARGTTTRLGGRIGDSFSAAWATTYQRRGRLHDDAARVRHGELGGFVPVQTSRAARLVRQDLRTRGAGDSSDAFGRRTRTKEEGETRARRGREGVVRARRTHI